MTAVDANSVVWLRRIARSLANIERMISVAQNGPGVSGDVGNMVRRPASVADWEREDDSTPPVDYRGPA